MRFENTRKMPVKPSKAMVLAAGLGVRMRPLTDRMPKPLVEVAGRALLDHVLDKLGEAGVSEAVVNVHYLPDQIIDHVAARARPRVIISDERDEVLGTGGGVVKSLPLLGSAPFFSSMQIHYGLTAYAPIWRGWPKPSIPRAWISCC